MFLGPIILEGRSRQSSGVALDFCHHSTDVGPVGIRDGQPRFCGNPLGFAAAACFFYERMDRGNSMIN